MKVYHGTRREHVEAILRNGFHDSAGRFLTEELHIGVWVSDRPLLLQGERSWDDGWIEIELEETLIAEYEWQEAGKSYREWLVPAELLNRSAKVRPISAEELSNLI